MVLHTLPWKWKCGLKDCGGRGENTCRNCNGHRYVTCGSGASNFLKRNIVGNIVGGGCGGTGKVKEDGGGLAGRYESGYRTCQTCGGRGEVPCEDCGTRGTIKCSSCNGRGEIKCTECNGRGDITCPKCYGDRERYGQVDCPQCKTIGTMAQIVFVESSVSKNETEKIIVQGNKLNINDDDIQKHINANLKFEIVYKRVNDDLTENYDEYSKIYAEQFEKELGLNKNDYPLLTKEEIYYQVIPCVELSYKHMLTNTEHRFTIIDFFNNPEIIFHSEPEQLKQNLGNVAKSVGGLFGKLLKSKSFKTKEDKRNEIVLLIHLAKVDGKIEEQEKVYLSEMIGNLSDFANYEKQKLFNIMNSETLPELTKKDVMFSSKEREQEVIHKLSELADSDGDMGITESALIDKIKSLMAAN